MSSTDGMMLTRCFLTCISAMILGYTVYLLLMGRRNIKSLPARPCPPWTHEETSFYDESDVPSPDDVPSPNDLQALIDFSDVMVMDEQKQEAKEVSENAKQMETVNERYQAAKRKPVEHKLKNGVYDHQQRRRLVEALLRRPICERRVRSWRTENSDTLRGDVIPKNVSSWGLMKMGRNNPEIDLHPGALGPMAGLSGIWLSEANVADNEVPDEMP